VIKNIENTISLIWGEFIAGIYCCVPHKTVYIYSFIDLVNSYILPESINKQQADIKANIVLKWTEITVIYDLQ